MDFHSLNKQRALQNLRAAIQASVMLLQDALVWEEFTLLNLLFSLFQRPPTACNALGPSMHRLAGMQGAATSRADGGVLGSTSLFLPA